MVDRGKEEQERQREGRKKNKKNSEKGERAELIMEREEEGNGGETRKGKVGEGREDV